MAAGGADSGDYRVLARKYRPVTFSGLIGQDVLVRTLTNAFNSGRLAHAFILTGVRGVGKTTTARIIARALNCIGPDGDGEPTTEPCGVCSNCTAIAADRHVDVLEMDAASRTGVDDIRELIDGVRYRPTSARYKVYIIDEVHMLSKNAFNALLKTLEEPPAHVKFIFATTEIRKVPVTVLSRCQRFDLARVPVQTLSDHFSRISKNEDTVISDGALGLIARAADGSVRDGLSLLDQAISQAEGDIDEIEIRDMLGLVDRSRTFELIEATLAGNTTEALKSFDQQYRDGADPSVLIEDMLEITHWLTRIKVVPDAGDAAQVPEIERVRGKDMSERLSMASLSRAWQILLKGLGEVRVAPSAKQAAEMVLVRLAYTANLPSPEEALKSLGREQDTPAAPAASTQPTPDSPAPSRQAAPPPAQQSISSPAPQAAHPEPQASNGQAAVAIQTQPAVQPVEQPPVEVLPTPKTFEEVLDLADKKRDGLLRTHLLNDIRLISFEVGRIEFATTPNAPATLSGDLINFLNLNTPIVWTVSISRSEVGDATVSEQRQEKTRVMIDQASEHPLIQAVMETFPGATIEDVRIPPQPEIEPVASDDNE